MNGFDGEASVLIAGAARDTAKAFYDMAAALSQSAIDDLAEQIAERARAFEHARMRAALIWPWPGREGYHLKDGL